MIPFHYLWAANEEFTLLTRWVFLAAAVDDLAVGHPERLADRAVAQAERRVRLRVGRTVCLSKPVSLLHVDARDRFELFLDGDGHLRTALAGHLECGQIVVDELVTVDDVDVHGGDTDEVGNRFLLDEAHFCLAVPARQ
ncbi:hypothetical protein C482_10247 [Natrialba chahannaoensis JCM 10990]|uniref:Uncharacterized protein n=1 Tax=Natrialba chahannaoensis JCM 10990 TaxID=1227492 RepID=M0API9_9EURY|nr:hypothetical protein C482_10247 [Natrialba chahannaoensis JCM 10990]